MRPESSDRDWVDPVERLGGEVDSSQSAAESDMISYSNSGASADRRDSETDLPSAGKATDVIPAALRGAPSAHATARYSLEGLADADPQRRAAEWERFFQAYHAPLMRAFLREEPEYDRRADLVQRIFLRAYRAIVITNRPLKSADKALSWLRTIGLRLQADVRDADVALNRMLGVHGAHLLAEESLQLHAENPLDRLSAQDPNDDRFPIDSQTLQRAVAGLSRDDQSLLRLRIQDELEWEDVGKAVGMTAENARQRYSRLRKHLRSL